MGNPVRMSSDEGSILSCLISYQKIPIEKKLELIFEMSAEYQAIGLMVAGVDAQFVKKYSPKEYIKAAERCGGWATSNRKGK